MKNCYNVTASGVERGIVDFKVLDVFFHIHALIQCMFYN